MKKEEVLYLIPYTFTITNTCDALVKYQVNLEVLNMTTLNHEYVKVQFEENTPSLLTTWEEVPKMLENTTTAYNLESGVLSKKGSKTFTLRLWLNENTPAVEDAMSKTLESKIVIQTVGEINRYTEEALNGADPVVKENLIPVTITDDGVVKKADIKKEWYNYENKNWANAVILKDESITYSAGATIPESNIESYFVWIPRYRYKIFNDTLYNGLTEIDTTKVQRIEVEFESRDVTSSNGTKNKEWLTHSAFTSFDSNGMWVGKFETSRNGGPSDNDINPQAVQIKPNVVSWRNIQVAKAFYTSYDYKRNLDSHMMKNTEWGAVVYLQHSKYGSETSVRFNNHSGYLTGYASTEEPTCGFTGDNRDCNKYGTTSDITMPYNTEIGYLASTTGNITGIYDMSGGVWEYMMSVMADQNGNPMSGQNASINSGFVGSYGEGGSLINGYNWPEEKYYEIYPYGTNRYEYTRRILGDATTEMGPFANTTYGNEKFPIIGSWYNRLAWSTESIIPWIDRGGDYSFGSQSGIITFAADVGQAGPIFGFRIILTP